MPIMSTADIQISDEEALQNFLLDIDCLDELLPWTRRFNLFDILKISRTEIRHSNMLGWLLNPNENHGLGDALLKSILQDVVRADSSRYDVFETLLMDLYSFSVYREWKNIDLLLISSTERCAIAIENKIGSHEHDNQLARYRKTLESDYPQYRKIYLYLTPDGEEPSDAENWSTLTYESVMESLSELRNSIEMTPDVALVIDNYLDVLRRDIVEDQKLVEVCNKIYAKHKKALDLIFEHKTDSRTQLIEAVRAALTRLSEEGVIEFFREESTNTFLQFYTAKMNDYLIPLQTPNSSWGNEHVYNYWIGMREDQLCGVFELGGWNIPDEEMEKMQRIIDLTKPSDKRRESFRYKRIFRTGWHQIEEADSYDDAVYNCVKRIVAALLKKEENLLKQLENKS